MTSKTVSVTTSSAVAASIGALAITVVFSDQLTGTLSAAASYPNPSGTTLADAQSWSMTYLLFFLGLGLVGSGVTAWAVPRGRRFARPTALATLALVTAFGLYNLVQPFPLAIKVAGLIPAVVGAGTLVAIRAVGSTRPAV